MVATEVAAFVKHLIIIMFMDFPLICGQCKKCSISVLCSPLTINLLDMVLEDVTEL